MRQVGTMSADRYIALAEQLAKLNIMTKTSATKATEDTLDEFTYHFSVTIGDRKNEFEASAISRPLAACYFAMRSLIDHAVDMSALWDTHSALAFQLTADNQQF
jgi:hypothetical protein